jgi:cytosine/adenosine deaminase-related metal-dependent hydrolase
MATLGGASLCRLESRIGNFLPGKEFDALRIKPASPGMWTDDKDTPEEVFEKWLFTGDDRDVADVWVSELVWLSVFGLRIGLVVVWPPGQAVQVYT